VLLFSIGIGTTPLAIAQSSVDWGNAMSTAGSDTLQVQCSGGGSVSLTLTSGTPATATAAGSQLSATLDACYLKPLGDSYSGTVQINYQAPSTGYQQSAVVTMQSGLNDISTPGEVISGQIAYQFSASDTDQLIQVNSATSPLTFNLTLQNKTTTETLTGINMNRHISMQTAVVTSNVSFTDASGYFSGTFNVSTVTPFQSWFDTYPYSGILAINGATGNAMTLAVSNANTPTFTGYLNGTAIGTLSFSDLCPYLFSGTGIIQADSSGQTYQLSPANAQPLTLLRAPNLTGVTPNMGPVTWYFSQPLSGMTNNTAEFGLTGSDQSVAWVPQFVNALMTIQGPMITVTPSSQFYPGATYQIAPLSGPFSPLGGGPAYTFTPQTVTVADTVNASISVPVPTILLGPSSTLMLDSSQSSATSGPIATTTWTQISGPAVNFSNTSSVATTISPASTGVGYAVIQVTVTNQAGNASTQQVSIPVVGDVTNQLVTGYSSGNAGIDTVAAAFMTGATSSINANNADNNISVNLYGFASVLNAYADTGGVLSTGTTIAYPDGLGGSLSWIPPNGSACSSATTGNINVISASYAGSGALQSLAMDVSVNCNGVVVYGAIRYNSAVPLTQ